MVIKMGSGAFELRPGMLLGVTSSATQIDGGDFGHTWNDWYEKGKISDGSDPAVAAVHWEKWREDTILMRKMGIETYRFSVEWARIEPVEGEFDRQAIEHVKEEIMLMLGMGIKPLLTLHHCTNPMWFEKKGGWEKPGNIFYFLRFVEKMVKAFGHLVSEYVTINEPNAYAVNGYMAGSWPPGKKSNKSAMQVMSVMAAAHIRAYRLIHDTRRAMGFDDTKVGFALQMRVFEPKNQRNITHVTSSKISEAVFQTLLMRAMATGEFGRPLTNCSRVKKGEYCDFLGLNYYTRVTVTGSSAGAKTRAPKSDLGWEIHPSGIVACAQKLYDVCPRPIYITENGACDNRDSFRARFIYDHINALCWAELPVERYYHRSFTDCFERLDGAGARFGLVYTDYATLERKIKKSGEFYAKLIENRGVTQQMYDEFISGQAYHFLSQKEREKAKKIEV